MNKLDSRIIDFAEHSLKVFKEHLLSRPEAMPVGFFLYTRDKNPGKINVMGLAIANLMVNKAAKALLPGAIQSMYDQEQKEARQKKDPFTLLGVLLISDAFYYNKTFDSSEPLNLDHAILASQHPDRKEGIVQSIYCKEHAQSIMQPYRREKGGIVFEEIEKWDKGFDGGIFKNLFPKI